MGMEISIYLFIQSLTILLYRYIKFIYLDYPENNLGMGMEDKEPVPLSSFIDKILSGCGGLCKRFQV
ncbi:hypothetical protein [Metabacillus endolithicus]|uniref:hypothetical protein n=1 Tax=Metabacillus endolithicus TaxID=1535204 RepID=UPI00366C5622